MLHVRIVGCGRISRRHADLLGGGRIEGARLSAVCDTDKKAQVLGEEFSVPAYASMDEMMQSEELDLVSSF